MSKVILLLIGICVSAVSYGKTIFIQYDKGCMDRYEYRYNGAGLGHIAYHIQLNNREKIILEVGIENKIVRPDRPTSLRNCQDVALNEKMVREINEGTLQVYVVRKQGNGYNVSPVGIATYNQISPSFIGFTSVDYKYVFNYNQLAADRNLAIQGSESTVHYKGMLNQGCPRKYQFERKKARAGRSYSEMVIVPEIGMIEERTGFNETDAQNNRLILISVNNTPLQQYIGEFCADKGINPTYSGSFYSKGRQHMSTSTATNIYDLETGTYKPGAGAEATSGNSGSIVNGTSTTSTSQPTTISTTTFQCTIYKDLDKNMYMDRATGLPAEGECGGNQYRNGRMLSKATIVSTTTTPATTSSPTTVSGNNPTPPGTFASSDAIYGDGRCADYSRNGYHIVQPNETLYGIARLYGRKVENIKHWNSLTSNLITPCMKLYVRPKSSINTPGPGTDTKEEVLASKGEIHIVQPNETLYQLAKQYGYTTERFRKMNGLGANDRIYIGQRLKTSDCNCPAPAIASTDIPQPAQFTADVALNDRAEGVPQSYDYIGAKREVHIVKEDETIFSIAKQYNMSTERLRALNKLEVNEIIIPYQRLYVN